MSKHYDNGEVKSYRNTITTHALPLHVVLHYVLCAEMDTYCTIYMYVNVAGTLQRWTVQKRDIDTLRTRQ